jgi:hypothetical protein
VSNHLPGADQKIGFDKYDIAGHLGNAVDIVRWEKCKKPTIESDDRFVGICLWLSNPANFTVTA